MERRRFGHLRRTGMQGLLLAVLTSGVSDKDVSFIVIGKTSNHRQNSAGDLALLNYHFFAEIFVREGGRVTNARLSFPGGSQQAFQDRGYVHELHGGRYDRESELDRNYPNGDYVFRFDTPGGRVAKWALSMTGTGSRIPPPPVVVLRQGGRRVSPESVDPTRDLEVSWSPFAVGEADPNGILDDLIFVVVGDCRGEIQVHSGRPFKEGDFLSYRATRFAIPAAKLAPGEPHQLFVEHARVNTSTHEGMVGLVAHAATTFVDFRTMGEAPGSACPPVMPRMDGGQTDRPPAR